LINTDLCYNILGGYIKGIRLLIPPHPEPLPQGEGIGGAPAPSDRVLRKFQ